MSALLGVPMGAAYHLVFGLATVLSPLFGSLAAATAIVVFTMAVRLILVPLSYRAMKGMDAQAKLAPQVRALRKKHSGQPEAFQRALAALYRAEGTSLYAGCLPILVQWPFFSVMYLVFRSPVIGGIHNALLSHDLFGAPLGSYLLSGAGLFSAHGAVFAGLFLVLAVIGWVTARRARALADTGGGAPTTAGSMPAALTRFMPYITVAFAAFLPLASGLYLATTSAWTLAERVVMRRLAVRRAALA
ncbi:MAG: YidC/Oxa1 family membrane protein insertase [Nocardiopsaceae bacterium]|jgi:YidC/Oxa1 family membrane protein insertase|nr:YidC/Oxa1 family membrane protein insertase [Nocardiopsaceae bacterium]